MVFDFASRPPDVTSALIYSGAGAGPLTAAASSFSNLSSELSSNAASYESVISQLTGSEWTGPSSEAMAAAAQPYITWLNTTSAQLQVAATQAIASAAAYEAAFAACIPPPVILANRTALATLVATNILGQNTPAIAANEALYGEFWAQDAAAMYAYASSASVASSTLTPLTPPAQTTNPAGPGQQAAAVSSAAGNNGTSVRRSTTRWVACKTHRARPPTRQQPFRRRTPSAPSCPLSTVCSAYRSSATAFTTSVSRWPGTAR